MTEFVRITSYKANTGILYAEHLYCTDLQTYAITRFRKEYPEHKDCIVVAEDYDPDENPSHFQACKDSGCVHFW